MVGDGVIAESLISYKITWKNPGDGKQPNWNQNDQEIVYHKCDVYPDLKYVKAQGIATYYTYTSLDAIIRILKEINSVIDAKMQKVTEEVKQLPAPTAIQRATPVGLQNITSPTQTGLQTVPKPGVSSLQTINKTSNLPSTIQKSNVQLQLANPTKPSVPGDPAQPNKKDEVTSDPEKPKDQTASNETAAYTVVVYGKQLKLIDVQLTSANVRVRHRVSANLIRKIDDEIIDNTKNIWLEVHSGLGKTVRMELKEFDREDGTNLLVQILPTVDLILNPDKDSVIPKSEDTINYEDKIKHLRRLRTEREENRYARSKQDTEAGVKKANSYWKKA